MKLIRLLARWCVFRAFLSEFEWYRRLHGGKWMRSHVDGPVHSCCWMDVPDHADVNYREPLWRGTPTFETWP